MNANPAIDPWSVFVPYTLLHAVTVLVCVVLIAALVTLMARPRDAAAERVQRRTLAAAALGAWVLSYLWLNWEAIDPKALPLQVCGLMGVVAPLALLTGNRWLRAAMYFSAFTLTIQAFIQPILVVGPAKLEFWRFWLLHSLILCCAVYDLVVLRFRPGWSDVTRAGVMSTGYVALIVPVNLMIGTNYGFVGNPPDQALPPVIALLGPWPERIFVLMALVFFGYVLALLPWVGVRRRTAAGRDRSPQSG
jgi:hypothetical integral membrane protein (TIGR02206 family)